MIPQLQQLVLAQDRLQSVRGNWETQWRDVRDYVLPEATDNIRYGVNGERLGEKMYDGTAPYALEQLSSALQSFLTSPSERWFNLCVKDYEYEGDHEVLMWLERISDILYSVFQDSHSNHTNALHETYLQLGGLGTSVFYQEYNQELDHILFRTFPLADCSIDENSNGIIDTVYRKVLYTTRQLEHKFPGHKCKKVLECKHPDRPWELCHAVFPRTDRDASKMTQGNKKYASVWFSREADYIFKDSGFDEFPYHVARWLKRTGEVYGRSPAMGCLPDIKMLNTMEKYQIKAVQKVVDPSLLAPNDGFIMPIDTTPGSIIWYESGLADNQMLIPLETKGKVEIGEEKLEQKRSHIMRAFYAEWIVRFRKKERQSVTEVMDDRDEMLSLMTPILGRIQCELLGPMLSRTYNILRSRRQLPPAPESIKGRLLEPEYIGPAAKAQQAIKGTNMIRYTQELMPFIQVAPEMLDIINPDNFARELSIVQNVSRKILRSPEEVEAIRAERKQLQTAAAAAQIAQPAAAAVKDLAQANQLGGIGAPQ